MGAVTPALVLVDPTPPDSTEISTLVSKGLAVTDFKVGFAFNKNDTHDAIAARLATLLPDVAHYWESFESHDDRYNPDFDPDNDPPSHRVLPFFHLLGKQGSYRSRALAIVANDFPDGAEVGQYIYRQGGVKKGFQHSVLFICTWPLTTAIFINTKYF